MTNAEYDRLIDAKRLSTITRLETENAQLFEAGKSFGVEIAQLKAVRRAVDTLFVNGFGSRFCDLAAEIERLRKGEGAMDRVGEAFVKLYIESGAKNYLAISLSDTNGVEFEVVLQRIGGETPAGKASRLEADLATLRQYHGEVVKAARFCYLEGLKDVAHDRGADFNRAWAAWLDGDEARKGLTP